MKAQKKALPQKFKLYDYFRSSACYRVRIAMNLKGIEREHHSIDLREGHQQGYAYRAINPQALVPSLQFHGETLSQSLAIIDYLDSQYPKPALLPKDPFLRAQTLEMAYMVACDIHPLNNLRVLNYLSNQLQVSSAKKLDWYQHWVREGFLAYEARLQTVKRSKEVSCGDEISLADVCLIPQVYNALRFEINMSEFPSIVKIYESCMKHPAFEKARPEAHPDAI